MLGLKKRDIKKALKAGAKAGGVSLADVRADTGRWVVMGIRTRLCEERAQATVEMAAVYSGGESFRIDHLYRMRISKRQN